MSAPGGSVLGRARQLLPEHGPVVSEQGTCPSPTCTQSLAITGPWAIWENVLTVHTWLVLERFLVGTSDVSYTVEIKAVHPSWVSVDKHGVWVAFLSGMSCSVCPRGGRAFVGQASGCPALSDPCHACSQWPWTPRSKHHYHGCM